MNSIINNMEEDFVGMLEMCIRDSQRAVYESVLNMMTYAKSILRPGILKSEYARLVRVFAAGELVKLGLVTPAQVAEKPSDPPIVRQYYMHGCSHFLGLDVHDVGETNPVVLPGMVFTIEPGIYIAEELSLIHISSLRESRSSALMATRTASRSRPLAGRRW